MKMLQAVLEIVAWSFQGLKADNQNRIWMREPRSTTPFFYQSNTSLTVVRHFIDEELCTSHSRRAFGKLDLFLLREISVLLKREVLKAVIRETFLFFFINRYSPPASRVGSTAGASRHPRLETEPSLKLEGLPFRSINVLSFCSSSPSLDCTYVGRCFCLCFFNLIWNLPVDKSTDRLRCH